MSLVLSTVMWGPNGPVNQFPTVLVIALAIQAVLYAVLYAVVAVGLWKTATKTGIFGLWAIIPVVQLFVLAKVAQKPLWLAFLFLVPILNIALFVYLLYEVSKRFGRGAGTAVGLFFFPFVFWPVLGFGSAKYSTN